MDESLYIIIPAYNEEENIEDVVKDWHKIVERVGGNSKLVVIDDGSKDTTYKILCDLKKELSYLVPLTKENSGHGATILFGYQYALDNNAEFIFQTDSDGQTLTSEFQQFWNQRNNYDVIIGYRNSRQDGLSRIFVTKVLKLVLFLTFRVNVTDANTPYRLMSHSILEKYIVKVPKDFNLSNVILTVLFIKNGEKVEFIPITFKPRQGGVNSINFKKIIPIGKQAVIDFTAIRKSLEE